MKDLTGLIALRKALDQGDNSEISGLSNEINQLTDIFFKDSEIPLIPIIGLNVRVESPVHVWLGMKVLRAEKSLERYKTAVKENHCSNLEDAFFSWSRSLTMVNSTLDFCHFFVLKYKGFSPNGVAAYCPTRQKIDEYRNFMPKQQQAIIAQDQSSTTTDADLNPFEAIGLLISGLAWRWTFKHVVHAIKNAPPPNDPGYDSGGNLVDASNTSQRAQSATNTELQEIKDHDPSPTALIKLAKEISEALPNPHQLAEKMQRACQ